MYLPFAHLPFHVFTANTLVAHGMGDYMIQSNYLANNKVSKPGVRLKSALVCLIHVLTYAAVFAIWFRPSLAALAVIAGSHFIIDHFRLAVWICWAKSYLDPGHPSWAEAKLNFGFSNGTPIHIAFWVMIITDNLIHVAFNAIALYYL